MIYEIECKHGRFWWQSQREIDAHGSVFQCFDCHQNFDMIILIDNLWLSIADCKYQHLCRLCIEGRLERKITIDDLFPCRVNLRWRDLINELSTDFISKIK